MFEPQWFLHAGNILLVVSYSVRDILWLRVFAFAASAITLPYYYFQATTLWDVIAWTALFMGINGFHICRLWLERRPVALSPDEQRLYDLTFFALPKRRFRDLVRLGRWEDVPQHGTVMREGERLTSLVVPLSTCISASRGAVRIGDFAAGDIIGGAAITSGRGASLDAIAQRARRVLRLPVEAVIRMAQQDPQLEKTLARIGREDLAHKLERLAGALGRTAVQGAEPKDPS
jgi:CRP-like cAMP-binding protein